MNSVNLTGRITRDLESRNVQDKIVVPFTIAVNGYNDRVDFIDCEVWGKQAENLVKYQRKGNLIGVSGSWRNDNFEDKDGNKRTKSKVQVTNIDFLTPKQKASDPFEDFGATVEDEELPF